MTVLMTSTMPGTTAEGYEHLAATLLPTLKASPGFIAHAAGPVEGGYLVTELWESEQAHEAWFAQHVRTAMPVGAPHGQSPTDPSPASQPPHTLPTESDARGSPTTDQGPVPRTHHSAVLHFAAA